MSVGEFFLQETDEGLGRRRPGEAMTCGDTVPWGREETLDGFPDGVGIIGVEVGSRIATDLTQHRNVGHQYVASAAHGLDGGQTKPFVERREYETDGLVVESHEFFVGDAAQIANVISLVLLILSKNAMTGAHDVELAILNTFESLNQTVEILAGVERGNSQRKALSGLLHLRKRAEEAFVSRIIDDGNVLLLEEGIEPQDLTL